MVAMQSADEVECVVHGTFYASWQKISQHGLRRTSQHSFIPCYPFVPASIAGPKAYQLYIFLDVRKAMSDGMKFFRVGGKQVLCTGDAKGVISPRYFIKVIDNETRSTIFSSRPVTGVEAIPGRHPSGHLQQQAPCLLSGYVQSGARGRGRGVRSGPPKGMELYQNIWSQVQSLDPDHVDTRPYQSQVLSALLNIPGEGAPASSQQIVGAVSNPGSSTGRLEVSVQDIFSRAMASKHSQGNSNPQNLPRDGQGEADILSMLNAAQQSHQNKQTQKSSSPSKSAFVPTQVIRKQTPRKPKAEDRDSRDGRQENTSGPSSPPQQENSSQQTQQQQKKQQQQPQQSNPPQTGTASRPKGPPRSRLAVRFDQVPG